jgi:type VI secretion system protein ImpE
MTPEELLKEGRPDEALKVLFQVVRDRPADARPRRFLFQLLSVQGDWKRAHTQLQVLAEMDSESMMLSRIFEPVLRCEAFRGDVFTGGRAPIIFGEPPEWIGQLVQALELFGKKEYKAAAELRAKAFEAAPATSGKLNGEPFDWIADADERLGPVLEVILEGHYYWIPFCRIRKIVVEAATDLRDLVWIPAEFVWENKGQASGHIPVRYPGSERSQDGLLKLARKTEWSLEGETNVGLGQRLLATNNSEYPLLEIRTIELDLPEAKTE